MIRYLWLAGGYVSLALALIGTALPVMPTVPFLLLATFCFSRSSKRLHRWLMRHPQFGGPLRDWLRRGAIARRVKILSTLAMAMGPAAAVLIGLPPKVVIGQAVIIAAIAAFIWTRPDA
ncbi:YbaN family protein [Paracoccus sp. p4-l81]|uniref:YbaN family protein n=1 Tax=Paracoccus sp. p4-l81 TaxID=3342806 RepID=UPI0035B6CC4C